MTLDWQTRRWGKIWCSYNCTIISMYEWRHKHKRGSMDPLIRHLLDNPWCPWQEVLYWNWLTHWVSHVTSCTSRHFRQALVWCQTVEILWFDPRTSVQFMYEWQTGSLEELIFFSLLEELNFFRRKQKKSLTWLEFANDNTCLLDPDSTVFVCVDQRFEFYQQAYLYFDNVHKKWIRTGKACGDCGTRHDTSIAWAWKSLSFLAASLLRNWGRQS